MRKGVWRREINEEADRRRAASNDEEGRRVEEQEAVELVKKRESELRHAEELSRAYRLRYERVTYMEEQFTANNNVSQFLLLDCLREKSENLANSAGASRAIERAR